MRITEVRETVVPLEGGVANAVVNFAGHTVSLVTVISDRVRAAAGFRASNATPAGSAGAQWVSVRLTPVRQDGVVTGVLDAARDVSEWMEGQESLQRSGGHRCGRTRTETRPS